MPVLNPAFFVVGYGLKTMNEIIGKPLLKWLLAFCLLLITRFGAEAQEIDLPRDSSKAHLLGEITVQAFEQRSLLSETPVAINQINAGLLTQFSAASIVNAVNATPGVRLEERSPGSYRLAIRGSSLRAPFGVRNVKIYYNGIPFTDPGGTTYLNQLGYYNINSIEILKGPGSSVYGAGTGGVMLISSESTEWRAGAKADVTMGSYNMLNLAAEIRLGKEENHQIIRYQRLTSNGYRDQSALQREVFSWDASSRIAAATKLDAHFLYGNLTYETPGALTLKEWDSAPRMARPGAAIAHATIYQQTFLAGFSVTHAISRQWSNITTLYGVYSQMRNPNLRNYSRTYEPNVGGRSVFKWEKIWKKLSVKWSTGAELQRNFTTIATYSNNKGQADSLQTNESVQSRQLFGFTQLAIQFNRGWSATAGLSLSTLNLDYALLSDPAAENQIRNFNNELSPRITLLKKINPHASVYGIVARGFSPPTSSELAPSGSILNLNLAPEWGWNYELGARGALIHTKLTYDLSLYYFALNHAIVQRRDALGGDYYINSGTTKQAGAELSLNYRLLSKETNHFISATARMAYTFTHFRYGQFAQRDKDYAGNILPGTPENTLTGGVHLETVTGIYVDATYYYNSRIQLNDANDAQADAYQLMGLRAGYQYKIRNAGFINLFGGCENITDACYTAGPDINGFGGRYYNASPGRNFYLGLSIGYQH